MYKKRRKEPRYYQIRASLLWGGIVLAIIAVGTMYFKENIFEQWSKNQEQIPVSYENLQSGLKNIDSCYLCGNSNQSLMGYFRQSDTIGLISLNDWYVLDFKLNKCEEQGIPASAENYGTIWGNTGEIRYTSESSPRRGMASIKVTLPESYDLNTTVIQEHLCQTCLDKVTKTLNFFKWKYEKKNTVPLCLVDFDTLEIYSLQDCHVGYFIRDYWTEIDFQENEINVEIFYLPER